MFTALVVGIWAARGWEVNGLWAPLVCAGATNAVADTAYLFMIATGTFREEPPVSSLWSAAALFVVIAAWRDVRDLAPTRLDGGRLLVVPVAVALMSLTVLLGDLVTPVRPPTQILAAAAVGAVVVRTALTFKEVALLADARRAARTDELTGLANRRAFHQHLAAALDPPDHPPRAAVLMIDLDRFKAVNDTLGHHVGDRLLTLVGQRFSGRVRAADVVARLGGDEFAVLLHGADLPAARRAAVALHHQLDEPFSIESATLQVGGSIGVAACPDHADDVEGLLRCADAGMYASKARGGGVTVFDAVRAAARRPRAHRERHPRAPVARQPRGLVPAALPAPARPALAPVHGHGGAGALASPAAGAAHLGGVLPAGRADRVAAPADGRRAAGGSRSLSCLQRAGPPAHRRRERPRNEPAGAGVRGPGRRPPGRVPVAPLVPRHPDRGAGNSARRAREPRGTACTPRDRRPPGSGRLRIGLVTVDTSARSSGRRDQARPAARDRPGHRSTGLRSS